MKVFGTIEVFGAIGLFQRFRLFHLVGIISWVVLSVLRDAIVRPEKN